MDKMKIVVSDMEGVLTPEVWKELGIRTRIDELKITTQDEPDYDKLMKRRIKILKREGITIKEFQKITAQMEPVDGAVDLIEWIRERSQFIILSDTFDQYARPLFKRLEWPTVLCHELQIDDKGFITDYVPRVEDQKTKTVKALQELNFEVIAIGDSYNDLGMLEAADKGILFRPPDSLREDNRGMPVCDEHEEVKNILKEIL